MRAVVMRSPFDAATMIECSVGLDLGLRFKEFGESRLWQSLKSLAGETSTVANDDALINLWTHDLRVDVDLRWHVKIKITWRASRYRRQCPGHHGRRAT